MSQPRDPEPVKLLFSIFSPKEELIGEVSNELALRYGPIDWQSPGLYFDRTRYYEREMGWPLYRRFLSFQDLISPDLIVLIKLESNELERRYLKEGKRLVNIDPGYMSLERLVLATGKNYVHRIYLGKGIYADLTLVYKRGSFRPLEWTYPDYGDPKTIKMFNSLRDHYLEQLREHRRVDREKSCSD